MDDRKLNDNCLFEKKDQWVKLLILFSFFTGAVFSQTTYLYNNDFSDPSTYFPLEKTTKGSTWCKDGKYYMNHTDSSGKSWRQSVFIQFDPHRDFIIETLIAASSSSPNSTVGLTFGYKDVEHGIYFIFDPQGNFMIVQMDGIEMNVIKDFTPSNALKENGQFNLLKVERKNNSFLFYINEQVVAETKSLQFADTRVGFYSEGKTKLESDFLRITQSKAEINLIPGWEKFGKKESLGDKINTKYGEKHPIISPDGQFLYVNREDNPYNTDGPKEDVWFSELKNNQWTKMKNLGYPINNQDYNYIAGISADNSLLLLGNVYSEDLKSMSEGFSISYKTKKGWGIPKKVIIENYYNKNKFNGACISADKKTIIMTIERDDTYGEKDLYVCFRKADSTWTEPLNMGAVVNTWAAEFGPYLAPDGKTLYYSSFGLPGYGEADLFVSKRLDDTWTNWSVPMNLGPKVNTKFWDGYFSVSAKGDYAYISSTEHGRADLDAYKIKMPQKEEGMVFLKGKITDDKTKTPLQSKLQLIDVATGKLIQEIESASVNGDYSILISQPGKYDIAAVKNGYISIHKTIEVKEITDYREIIQDIALSPLEAGSTIILKNIFFEPNKSDLLPSSNEELNKLLQILKDNPNLKIEVSGHTSKTTEGEDFNVKLSTNRALAVKTFLIQNGISENRITHKGFGYSKPLFKENDEFHQSQNRRVEFTILSK